jgi:hypothetical protein
MVIFNSTLLVYQRVSDVWHSCLWMFVGMGWQHPSRLLPFRSRVATSHCDVTFHVGACRGNNNMLAIILTPTRNQTDRKGTVSAAHLLHGILLFLLFVCCYTYWLGNGGMGCSIVSMDHSPMPYEAPVRTNCHICVIHREFMFFLCFTHVFFLFSFWLVLYLQFAVIFFYTN